MKLQNGKRRWRRILKLMGVYNSHSQIRWYAENDRELERQFYANGGRLWRDNADWRQNSLSKLNNYKIFK